MKNFIYILFLFTGFAFAQGKYLTKTGNVQFEASVPSFEEVAAESKSVTAILDTSNGELAALVFVKGFRFKNALMEEHFNENYAETDKYPKATFRGKIQGFDLRDLSEIDKTYFLDGVIDFHGVSKSLNDIEINLKRDGESIHFKSELILLPSDFDIKIPKIVRNKVAEDVNVNMQFDLVMK